ncbi:MAG: PIN domain nuclease [Armatimonadetes bacterium]|nr:PIN domain nuclease [Armatimonadota bacterium]
MSVFLKFLFYIILGVFGGLVGLKISIYFQPHSKFFKEYHGYVVGLGIFLGWLLVPLFVKLIIKAIDWIITSLLKITLQEIILGAIGLIFGLIIAYLLSSILNSLPLSSIPIIGEYIAPFLGIILTIFCCYLGIYFSIRLNIMHLGGGKFSLSESRGYFILDTSVIIDGRILDISKTGFLDGEIIVPTFILSELQAVADSSDTLKRNRGRRGLDLLEKLKHELEIQLYEKDYPQISTDTKLIKLSKELKANLVTTDFNLAKVASLQGVKVLNINELALAIKPVILPGEEITVAVVREGREAHQGVSYLEDGTMVVIEDGRRYIGEQINVEVTSVLQTVSGKMIFARRKESHS